MESISLLPPENFHPKIEVAGCYCEYENKILLLKRAPHKLQGMTWGIPGGKLESEETPVEGVIREVFEEIGLKIDASKLSEIDTLYVRRSSIDYIFYRFRAHLSSLPVLHLNLEEHVEARWVTLEEALDLPLIYGGAEALVNYRTFLEDKVNLKGS